MSHKDWTAPAPLEVERPRLPWWVMLPRKVLLVVLPLILAWAAWTVGNFTARRVYRYPVLLLGTTGAVWLGLATSWWWTAGTVSGLGLVLAVWWRLGPDSYGRTVTRQVHSEIRRARIYAPAWRRTMRFADLCKHVRHEYHYPRIARLRSDGWRDRVLVKLLHGQSPDAYWAKLDELAHSFGAISCRVRSHKPRQIWLDFIHSDPLRPTVAPPELADPDTVVNLSRAVIGATESGRRWALRLLGNHLLVVGSTGAGKSSVMWSLLWYLAPAIRSGAVQVFGIDPKGGMELGRAPRLFTRLVNDNGADAVELLEHVATLTRQRAEGLRDAGRKAWTPDAGSPFVLLVVDELADIVSYQTDRGLKTRANAAVQTIASQGRAPGVCVLGQVQDPRKSVIDFRHLFPTKVALRLDEADQVDLALGEGARARGAAAHQIPEDTPGVAWVCTDGRRQVDRARAFHVDDTHLSALSDYVTGGAAPRALPTLQTRKDAA